MSHPGRPRTIDDALVARMHASGVPVPQIAAWLGKTRGAVYVAIRRARGVDTSAAHRIAELEEALQGLQRSDGHFTERCADNAAQGKACPLRCRRALAALGRA